MVGRISHRSNRGGKNQVSNVRIIDENKGTDGATADRMLASIRDSQSQVRLVCNDSFTQSVGSNAVNLNYSGSTVRATDDFASLAQQFELYRVRAIRFDIFDVNQQISVTSFWSTFHDTATAAYGAFGPAAIVDGPDFQSISPGTGHIQFTWMAHGDQELAFQSTTNTPQYDFGGLRFYINAGTSAGGAKYQVIMKAIVDFRGRT